MNESELSEGCLVAFEGFNCTTIRGYYFSLQYMLPNTVDGCQLASWGLVFDSDEAYHRVKDMLYDARSAQNYWDMMREHGEVWNSPGHMHKYHFIEVSNCRCTRLPGRGIGPLERAKHRRGKRHRMHEVSLPVYPTPGMEPICELE